MWTSSAESAWLTDRIPSFREVRDTCGKQIQEWLLGTAPQFLAAFPEHPTRETDALVKVRANFFCFERISSILLRLATPQLVLLPCWPPC
jgi:hypothetical protein